MRFSLTAVVALMLGGASEADDFEGRLHEAEAKLGDLGAESQRAAADILLKLAEQDENRLAEMLPGLEVDAQSRAHEILASHGVYLDSRKTKRAREILEVLSKPPRARNPLGYYLRLEPPDPERRKLVEEFLALGATSVLMLNGELGNFEVEAVKTPARVVEVGAKESCAFRLKNVSQHPLWFLPESAIARVEVQRVHFDIPCLAFMDRTKEAPASTRSAEDRVLDLLALMTRVKPGEEFEYASVEIPTAKAGMAVVVTSRVRAEKLCGFEFPLEASIGGGMLSIELRQPVDSPSARFYVMGAGGIEPFSFKTFDENRSCGFELASDEGIAERSQQPAYCWWIAEGPDGEVLSSGAFGGVEIADTDWRETAKVRLKLPAAPPEGTRRLWLGFQCEGDRRARVAEAIEVKGK